MLWRKMTLLFQLYKLDESMKKTQVLALTLKEKKWAYLECEFFGSCMNKLIS